MMPYDWKINGRNFADTQPLPMRQGQRATLTFNNTTTMWHPMHLHGHTFQVIKPDGSPGTRKDTAIVLPKQKVSVKHPRSRRSSPSRPDPPTTPGSYSSTLTRQRSIQTGTSPSIQQWTSCAPRPAETRSTATCLTWSGTFHAQ